MRYVIKSIYLFSFIGCSLPVFATSISSDSLGAQKYDAIKCVADTKQNCINSVCLNSTERNCQGNCEQMAQQKCRQQANE